MAAATAAIKAEVAALETPLERGVTVTQLPEVLREEHGAVADLRVAPAGELRRTGMSLRAIAETLGISLNAVVQIEHERRGRPRWRPRALIQTRRAPVRALGRSCSSTSQGGTSVLLCGQWAWTWPPRLEPPR